MKPCIVLWNSRQILEKRVLPSKCHTVQINLLHRLPDSSTCRVSFGVKNIWQKGQEALTLPTGNSETKLHRTLRTTMPGQTHLPQSSKTRSVKLLAFQRRQMCNLTSLNNAENLLYEEYTVISDLRCLLYIRYKLADNAWWCTPMELQWSYTTSNW